MVVVSTTVAPTTVVDVLLLVLIAISTSSSIGIDTDVSMPSSPDGELRMTMTRVMVIGHRTVDESKGPVGITRHCVVDADVL